MDYNLCIKNAVTFHYADFFPACNIVLILNKYM